MNQLVSDMASRFCAGLNRSAIRNAADWALTYRTLRGQPWSFDRHPWLREPHEFNGPFAACMKGAQIGFTEWLLNLTFYLIDIEKQNVFYGLPNKDNAKDFSSARFDPALEENAHLRNLFSDVKNVGMKRAGINTLYCRGVQSRGSTRSVDTAGVMRDEIDVWPEFARENSLERASGQEQKWIRSISTPSIPKVGIHSEWLFTDQSEFMFLCPRCGQWEQLTFDADNPEDSSLYLPTDDPLSPDVRHAHYRCKKTKLILPHEEKGLWLSESKYVPAFPGRDEKGFHCNQLYSFSISPQELTMAYLKARTNPAKLQEFYNNKIGTVYITEGAAVSDEEISNCTTNHKMGDQENGVFRTLGVDVGGTWLHVTIEDWFGVGAEAVPRPVLITKVRTFEEVDALILKYRINSGVIDAGPETRKSKELCERFPGLMMRNYYVPGRASSGLISESKEANILKVDRTFWLDQSQSRFAQKRIALPVDTPLEFKEQIKASVRSYRKDKRTDEMVAYYVAAGDDHYGHARVYSEIAYHYGMGVATSQDLLEVPI